MSNLCAEKIKMLEIRDISFKKIFEKYRNKSIVIYGLNLIAKEILSENPEFNFVGVMDDKRKDGYFMDKKILSEREMLSLGTDLIILTEEIPVAFLTYQTIYHITELYNIPIFYMTGANCKDVFREIDYQKSQYMCVDEIKLKKKILKYDVISFDVFDTLIMRTILFPRDVFELIQNRAESNGVYVPDFKEIRREAERRLSDKVPNLDQIYNEIQGITGLSDEDKEIIKNLEIEIEKEVIIPRYKMIEIFHYALEMGKTVYLTSDMYLPKKTLEPIVQNLNIIGYKDFLISCDYGTNKYRSLFKVLKQQIGEKKCLHIGDNEVADIAGALIAGIDAFYVKSALELMKSSDSYEVVRNSTTFNERAIVGLLISSLFNNPFSLYGKNGKMEMNTQFSVGYYVLGPILIGFFLWMREEGITLQNTQEKNDLVFALEEIDVLAGSCKVENYMQMQPKYIAWLLSYEERFRSGKEGYKIYMMQDSLNKKQVESANGKWYIDNEILRKKSGKYLNSNIKLIKKYLNENANCFMRDQMIFGVKKYAECYLQNLYIQGELITPSFCANLLNQFDLNECQ